MAILNRVRTVFTGVAGSPWYSNMYFGAATTPQAAADAVSEFWSSIDGQMSSGVDWAPETSVAQIDDTTGDIVNVTSITATGSSGALTDERLPTATQICINWHTGGYIAGRELRGKTFIPGLTQTANDNGNPTASIATTVGAAASVLYGSTSLVVFSPTHLTSRQVEAHTIMPAFAVLRSRRD